MKKTIILNTFLSLIVLNINYSLMAGLFGNADRIELTPPLEMKFALGGYGARLSKPAEGIHDRIWAKALVLSNGTKKYVVVTMDLLALPPNVKPQVIKQLSDKNWTEKNVLFLPSHSHTSLDMTALNDKNNLNIPQLGIFQPELLEFVIGKLVEVIKNADQNLKPIAIGTARTELFEMNRNRRGIPVVDRDLTITRIDYPGKKPLAVLVNWTAHPTLMDERDMWVSGGWPGFLQRELEDWIGQGITAMYYNGAEGDLSPLRPEGGSHFEQAEIYGRQIAKKTFEVYQNIETDSTACFDYNYYQLSLPDRQAHPLFKLTGGAEYGINDSAMGIILNTLCPQISALPSIRLGDLLIAGVPGELSSELGVAIKQTLSRAGAKYPVIGGFANEWISYILSETEYKKGGYEASVSFYGSDLGRKIVEGVLESTKPLLNK
jgi:neutral ceramidase